MRLRAALLAVYFQGITTLVAVIKLQYTDAHFASLQDSLCTCCSSMPACCGLATSTSLMMGPYTFPRKRACLNDEKILISET